MGNFSAEEKLKYRIQLFRDAQSFRKPDRVPYQAALTTWHFYQEGYTPAVAARDYQIIETSIRHFVEQYPADRLLNTGFRNPFPLSDAVGGQSVTDESNLNAIDICYLNTEDYDEILKGNYQKLVYEKYFLAKFPQVKNFTASQFAQAARTYKNHMDNRNRVRQMLQSEYGIAQGSSWSFSPFFDELFTTYRGIRGMAVDLRRSRDKVFEVCRMMDEQRVDAIVNSIMNSEDGPDMSQPFDGRLVMLGHTIVNKKQFEKLYAEPMEKILRAAEKKNKQVYILSEGEVAQFGDFFNQFKKGTVSMAVENDIFEFRKKFPNIAIYGGIFNEVMSNGTPEQCVSMVKRSIDELGCEGGLVLTENKFLAFPRDVKPENQKAIVEFIQSYRL